MSTWDGTRWIADRPASPVGRRPRNRAGDWFATVIMLAGLVIIVFPGNFSEAAGPRLNASPPAARPGDILSISGRGFSPHSIIQLAWDGSVKGMPAIKVNGRGILNSRVIVTDSTLGGHAITALGPTDVAGRRGGGAVSRSIASVSVTVLASVGGHTPTPSTPSRIQADETSTEAQSAVPAAQPTAQPTVPPTAPPPAQPTPAPPAQPTPAPPPFTPVAGLPTIDPTYGTLLRKVFTDGSLGPFRVLTYPDDHIGGSGQHTTVYNRFSNGAQQASVHDGYLDLRATRRTDGLWDAVLLGTSQDGNGLTFGYGVFRFWLSFNIAPQAWQAAWLYDTTTWTATEIDFPEMLENLSLTAAVLGQGAGASYGLPRPPDLATVFHEFRVERRATFVAYSIDGVEVARINGAMPNTRLAILLDSKVGFPWMGTAGAPGAGTPDITYLRVAAVTVDP